MEYRLLVCGSRTYGVPKKSIIGGQFVVQEPEQWRAEKEQSYLKLWLDKLVLQRGRPSFVITGGADGADTFAEHWRVARGLPGRVENADWTRLGRKAGVVRNKLMLDLLCVVPGPPKLVVAFPRLSEMNIGTTHMMTIARAKGVEVINASETII